MIRANYVPFLQLSRISSTPRWWIHFSSSSSSTRTHTPIAKSQSTKTTRAIKNITQSSPGTETRFADENMFIFWKFVNIRIYFCFILCFTHLFLLLCSPTLVDTQWLNRLNGWKCVCCKIDHCLGNNILWLPYFLCCTYWLEHIRRSNF